MASGSGKMSLPLGACNGTAADCTSVEKELYDYQMHTKMCKKIAQLTKVIYSLNAKNEEQEATLQTLLHVATETSGSLQPTASKDKEDEESASVLRSRLLELQATVEEVEEHKQRAEFEHAELVAVLTQEAADLRRNFHSVEMERDRQCRLLQQIQEEKKLLEEECQNLRQVRNEERKREENEKQRKEEEKQRAEREELRKEERIKVNEDWEKRLHALREELKTIEEKKRKSEDEWKMEKEEMRSTIRAMEEERKKEQEEANKAFQLSLNERMNQWQKKEQDTCKFQNSLLQQRLKKAETELETREERLNECSRHSSKLQARLEDLEDQLENGHHRIAEAEKIARKAEEELSVAKERLLLQENELQSKSEELLSQNSSQVQVSAEVEDLKTQLSRLNMKNKELELQNSGRSNDHARMLKQHADTLSSMRLELQRAHAEEIKRLHQEVEEEKRSNNQEWEDKKMQVQKSMEKEKIRLKEQLQKALEEINQKHANELRQIQSLLDAERKEAEEQRMAMEEERHGLEQERKELQEQIQISVLKINELEEREVAKNLEAERQQKMENETKQEEEKTKSILQPLCMSTWQSFKDELDQKDLSIQQMEGEFLLERDQLQAEISSLKSEREVLQQVNHSMEERMRLQFEKHFSDHVANLQKEREKEVSDMNLQWQQRVEDLQTQLEEKRVVLKPSREEREMEDHHANGEVQRMKLEIQKTREMNSSLRAQLHTTIQEKEWLMKKQQLQVVQEEDEDKESMEDVKDETKVKCEKCELIQKEVVQAERLNHQRALQNLETHAHEELQAERQHLHTQYKLQLEKQKAELTQQHTEWVRQLTQRHMQQIVDLQNELQTHTEMMALQQDLKQQNKVQSLERQLDERSSEVQGLKREKEELKERVNVLTEREAIINKRMSISSLKEKEDSYGKSDGEERNDGILEETEAIKKEKELDIQTVCNFSSTQAQLQARIVALETKLREREKKGKRRLEDLHTISKLQDKLSERDQLIKKLVEDLHQLSQHPPLSRDGVVTTYNTRAQGSLTPTIKRKVVEEAQHSVTSIPNLFSLKGGSTNTSPSASRRIIQSQSPVLPHSEARTSVRLSHVSPTPDLPYQLHLNNSKHNRTPSEQRVIETGPDAQDPQRQEWFTKYFSF